MSSHSLKDHYSRSGYTWSTKLPVKQEDIETKFKRGNLVISRLTKKEIEDNNITWAIRTCKYMLVLGKLHNDSYYSSEKYHYLVKISISTKPTLNSKGHTITIVGTEDLDKYFKLSIAEAFRDL